MRRAVLIPLVLASAGVGTAVMPARAADQTVVASLSNVWEPDMVNIAVGEQVTFRNGGGVHNLRFADEPAARNAPSGSPWTTQRRFDAAGRFTFYCEVHQTQGMTGVVVVSAAGSPPPPPPAPTFTVRPTQSRFCTKRSKTCRKPGIVLKVKVSADAILSGTLERRPRPSGAYRADGRVRVAADAGAGKVTILRRTNGKRIGPGYYRLSVRARMADGVTAPAIVRFAVRT
jgi:plastocyanin